MEGSDSAGQAPRTSARGPHPAQAAGNPCPLAVSAWRPRLDLPERDRKRPLGPPPAVSWKAGGAGPPPWGAGCSPSEGETGGKRSVWAADAATEKRGGADGGHRRWFFSLSSAFNFPRHPGGGPCPLKEGTTAGGFKMKKIKGNLGFAGFSTHCFFSSQQRKGQSRSVARRSRVLGKPGASEMPCRAFKRV